MGGSALHFLQHEHAFPRMPIPVYRNLKSRLYPVIQGLYSHVIVPIEAPEKKDYGDLDFLVYSPKTDALRHGDAKINVSHDSVKDAIGARHFIPADGNRTSNFAVPVSKGEWATLGYEDEEEANRKKVEDGEIYYQVDVHVCADKAEWDRIFFFNSYGDLGMIMGLVAANIGLHLGSKGLQYSHPPHRRIDLSDNFEEIAEFFGWSMETRNAGFATRQQVFDWVTTSRFFDASRFRTQGEGIRKVKPQRTMYSDFVEWVGGLRDTFTSLTDEEKKQIVESARAEALEHFGKREEVESMVRNFEARKRMKDVFNGVSVKSWIGAHQWQDVKSVMDRVREQHGGDEGVSTLLDTEGEGILQQRVLEAFRELKIDK
ncbi:hypothetical protein D9758_002685 [Tetrapyrgos nigripes]|uniref:Uncharacterized protein n=1 Tax=Tetrapyrgos nigripes TaxID=182062 RepID=A0A8H5GQY8_9AGAR|nr:hypothetical protein D9758_002685 [Tetrapyrgos nigripes]